MIEKNSKYNPWTDEDEREHYPPCLMEWWAAEAFFTSIEDKKKWSLKVAFTEWYENPQKIGSISNITLFNQDDDKHYVYCKRDDSKRLKSEIDTFYVQFEDSFMKGSFPVYNMRFINPKYDIEVNLKLEAESYPHWIAQEITNGWLPMGFGLYRYGFIPRTKLTGKLRVKDKTYNIEGIGYFEHVWGDFDYDKPFYTATFKKALKINLSLIRWWLKNNKIKIPKSITFTSENNPFGYDWAWAVFDNNWSIFYGNSMFWIMDGPAMGILVLTKDGKKYISFPKIRFHYNKLKYADDYDFYYPTELQINAIKGVQKLDLTFKMTTTPREYISIFPYAKYIWIGLAICEIPGVVEGYYYNGLTKTKLSGICKIEPQRQIEIIGHNKLKIDIKKPPKGVGIKLDFESHYFMKKLFFNLQFAPRPKINIKTQRIDCSKINKNIRY
jgi:hypothetical protein